VTCARVRDLSASPVEYLEVHLAIPRPLAGQRYERFFDCPVRYDAPHSTLVMTRLSWEAPLERSEPRLRDILQRHADTLMAAVRHDDGLAPVRTEIQRQLPNGAPKLGTVAKALAMSARTLQCRLQEHGTSFQALVDEERAAAARAYLSDARLGLDEIAFLLGYSEASAFSRAFKRWTGRTPQGYRGFGVT
jgi:AraC-like DNA-binding protein